MSSLTLLMGRSFLWKLLTMAACQFCLGEPVYFQMLLQFRGHRSSTLTDDGSPGQTSSFQEATGCSGPSVPRKGTVRVEPPGGTSARCGGERSAHVSPPASSLLPSRSDEGWNPHGGGRVVATPTNAACKKKKDHSHKVNSVSHSISRSLLLSRQEIIVR